jgi:hypothetical protein
MQSVAKVGWVSVIFALGLGAVGSLSAQEFITNGSLTGPIANGGVPTGWTILAGSPDTMDENNNVGGSTPFGIDPSGPSPDGGTWLGFATGSGGFREIFGQTVTGLTVGEEYEISWYAGNFGARTGPGYTDQNSILVSLDGSSIGSGGVLPLASNWVSESVSFTATATSHDLSFGLTNEVNSYLSIDGISLMAASEPPPTPEPRPAQPVPSLSEWALIVLTILLGFVGLYRLREARR